MVKYQPNQQTLTTSLPVSPTDLPMPNTTSRQATRPDLPHWLYFPPVSPAKYSPIIPNYWANRDRRSSRDRRGVGGRWAILAGRQE
jgi:hypothetical protein